MHKKERKQSIRLNIAKIVGSCAIIDGIVFGSVGYFVNGITGMAIALGALALMLPFAFVGIACCTISGMISREEENVF